MWGTFVLIDKSAEAIDRDRERIEVEPADEPLVLWKLVDRARLIHWAGIVASLAPPHPEGAARNQAGRTAVKARAERRVRAGRRLGSEYGFRVRPRTGSAQSVRARAPAPANTAEIAC